MHSNDAFVFSDHLKKCPKHRGELSKAEVSPHITSPDRLQALLLDGHKMIIDFNPSFPLDL